MYCWNCGTEVDDKIDICPSCGVRLANDGAENAAQTEQLIGEAVTVKENLPNMKWYKFLIYFALWATMVVGFAYGVLYLAGVDSYLYQEFTDEVYKLMPAVKIMDMISGVYYIALAVFAVYVRYQLKNFKKNAPKLLCLIYIMNAVVAIISIVVLLISAKNVGDVVLYGESFVRGGFIYRNELHIDQIGLNTSAVVPIIVAVAMAGVNYKYFKTRESLFIN